MGSRVKVPTSHPGSISRQTQFDFNRIQDRDYKYFVATNDDGWLVGGGENGDSFKLTNSDSAHCEIIRVGTFNEAWGGASRERIREVNSSNQMSFCRPAQRHIVLMGLRAHRPLSTLLHLDHEVGLLLRLSRR